MNLPDTPVGLCRLIGQVRSEIVVSIERALTAAGIGLNFSQFLTLKRLGEEGPMTPSELAPVLGCTTGALTRLLDKLEHLGYLRRVPHPSDRRSLRLELTRSGRAIRSNMVACAEAAAKRAFTDLSGAERRQLHGLLLRVLNRSQSPRRSMRPVPPVPDLTLAAAEPRRKARVQK